MDCFHHQPFGELDVSCDECLFRTMKKIDEMQSFYNFLTILFIYFHIHQPEL